MNRVRSILDQCYHEAVTQALPTYLHLCIGDRCNLKCKYCLQGLTGGTIPPTIMRRENAFQLLPLAAGAEDVGLYGTGEPLLCPDLYDFIHAFKRLGKCVHTNTNALFLDQDHCARLIESQIDRVFVSIDGATQSCMDRLRDGADLGKVVKNIKGLLHARSVSNNCKPEVFINMSVSFENYLQMPAMVLFAYRLGVNGVNYDNIVFYRDFLPLGPFARRYKSFKLMWITSKILGKKAGVSVTQNTPPFWSTLKDVSFVDLGHPCGCPQVWNHAFINADGGVQPCCFLPMNAGNAFQQPVNEILNSAQLIALRRQMLNGMVKEMCADCPQLERITPKLIRKRLSWARPLLKTVLECESSERARLETRILTIQDHYQLTS